MMKYLLKVTITPVQEFIKEARKTRDLWVGSKLLSAITYEALTPFIKNSCEIIFPYVDGTTRPDSLPNHFLVIISNDKADNLLNQSQNTFICFWKKIALEVKQTIQNDFNGINPGWDKLWNSQVDDLWHYMWVAIPASDNELASNYKKKAQEVQRLLEERKLTRTFKQWIGNNAEKCTQCGHREVLGPEIMSENRKFWYEIKKRDEYKVKFKKGDRLCAICTIKRLVTASKLNQKEPDFDSTSDIAAIPFKQLIKNKITNNQKENFIKQYKDLAEIIGEKKFRNIEEIPGIFFYKEELRPKELVKEYFPGLTELNEVRNKESDIKNAAAKLLDELKNIEKTLDAEPTKYYAILAMDGDEIGKWLYNVQNSNEQKGKSKTLSEMAKSMEGFIKQWDGRWIYLGGDDLLAFGPLEKTLTTCCQIYKEFVNSVKPQTISASILLTHYSNPLRKDLEIVRENIEKAKEKFGRDAIVITVHLASGNLITAGYKWRKVPPINENIVEIISRLVKLIIQEEKIKKDFIFDIIKEIPSFYNRESKKFNKEMFEVEALRLYRRHRPGLNQMPMAEKKKEEAEIRQMINALSTVADPNELWKRNFDVEKIEENFINLLRITAFFIREKIKEV